MPYTRWLLVLQLLLVTDLEASRGAEEETWSVPIRRVQRSLISDDSDVIIDGSGEGDSGVITESTTQPSTRPATVQPRTRPPTVQPTPASRPSTEPSTSSQAVSRTQSTLSPLNKKVETTLHQSSGSSSTTPSMESLLASQQEVLVELKAQMSSVSSRLVEQEVRIARQDRMLVEQSWSLADLKEKQTQTRADVDSLKTSYVREGAATTPSHPREMTPTTDPLTRALSAEVRLVESRVTYVEELQRNLANVLQHVVSEKVWVVNSSLHKQNTSEAGEEADFQSNRTVTGNGEAAQRITESEAQILEERTNKVLTSIDKWKKVERVLHTSLADLHSAHRGYDSQLSSLVNYTENNGHLMSELAQARLQDGGSILRLFNFSSRLGWRMSELQATVEQNKNVSEAMVFEVEQTLGQILELIQLNSLKVTTLQDAMQGQRSLVESHLNQTVVEILNLQRSLSSLSASFNSSRRSLIEKVQSNKERSDMLWSRFRILDNRLAHVEVKYLTEELNKYQKSNDDLRQSLKLLEIENQLETMEENIRIQQTNHETLDSRINSVTSEVTTASSSLADMKTEWAEFSGRLPTLELMYGEVQMMISVLPKDCDAAYRKGIRSSGVQLVKPGPAYPNVKVLCEIDTGEERGWTLVQHRYNGELDFNRNWTDYRKGFGDVESGGEFWIGNELLHTLTSEQSYSVHFGMLTVNGSYFYAEYDNFAVLSETEGYRLNVSGYSGNATDSLRHSNNMSFSTIDVDNDSSSTHCAQFYTAGWWYKYCHYCNINGRYTVGMVWFNHDADDWMELKETTMKISRRLSAA